MTFTHIENKKQSLAITTAIFAVLFLLFFFRCFFSAPAAISLSPHHTECIERDDDG